MFLEEFHEPVGDRVPARLTSDPNKRLYFEIETTDDDDMSYYLYTTFKDKEYILSLTKNNELLFARRSTIESRFFVKINYYGPSDYITLKDFPGTLLSYLDNKLRILGLLTETESLPFKIKFYEEKL